MKTERYYMILAIMMWVILALRIMVLLFNS